MNVYSPTIAAQTGMADVVGEDGKLIVPTHVEEAIRTLIRWSGDEPEREGLLDTPKRVARAWKEYCLGYGEDPSQHLSRTFYEVGGYDEIVLLRDLEGLTIEELSERLGLTREATKARLHRASRGVPRAMRPPRAPFAHTGNCA